ncbi:hypothetical protein MtrunA17_Chr1g0150871 [Medicago truncatula]|uniref:Transmembrane protein, putative n=1 Tax=Medicago truncatula TaxID=3880 RepID=G7I8Z9_MEDTR|nr:transmembrane protein, putative [Medicago truncatula]RHN77080.1 hypothetical protein MtrunA17_Chr1g0150871 [Medicago truncatula]
MIWFSQLVILTLPLLVVCRIFIWVCKFVVGLLIELFVIRFVHIEGRFGNLEFEKPLTDVAIN